MTTRSQKIHYESLRKLKNTSATASRSYLLTKNQKESKRIAKNRKECKRIRKNQKITLEHHPKVHFRTPSQSTPWNTIPKYALEHHPKAPQSTPWNTIPKYALEHHPKVHLGTPFQSAPKYTLEHHPTVHLGTPSKVHLTPSQSTAWNTILKRPKVDLGTPCKSAPKYTFEHHPNIHLGTPSQSAPKYTLGYHPKVHLGTPSQSTPWNTIPKCRRQPKRISWANGCWVQVRRWLWFQVKGPLLRGRRETLKRSGEVSVRVRHCIFRRRLKIEGRPLGRPLQGPPLNLHPQPRCNASI